MRNRPICLMQSVSGRSYPRHEAAADENYTIAILSEHMKILAVLPVEKTGGSLTIHSDGPGQGAAFTPELSVGGRDSVSAVDEAGVAL